MKKQTEKIKLGSYTWYALNKPNAKELAHLANQFNLPHLVLKEAIPSIQRPKLIAKGHYLFVVLLYPIFNKNKFILKSSEIDYFIGKNFVITIHQNNKVIKDLFKKTQKDQQTRKSYINQPIALLADIAELSLDPCWEILNSINNQILKINSKILNISNKTTLMSILETRILITHMQKIMRNHRKIILRLEEQASSLVRFETHTKDHLNHTIYMLTDIWDNLMSYENTVQSLQQTYESAATHKLNNIVKILTIFSAVVLPSTLIASIFSMKNLPEELLSSLYFWPAIAIMLLLDLILFIFFKTKKWL